MTVRVTPDPIDAPALIAAFQAANPDAGAIAVFVGQVRGGDGIEALDLEIYHGFTQAQVADGLSAIAATVDDFLAVHRYGRIAVGEAVVLVVAAGRHRRVTFAAVDRAMDWLKTQAAFWKREISASGHRWVEPRQEDYDDAQRWG